TAADYLRKSKERSESAPSGYQKLKFFVSLRLRKTTRRRKRKLPSKQRGRLPAGCPPARRASCGACLLFAFRGVFVCGKCRRRSTWREHSCEWPRPFRVQ